MKKAETYIYGDLDGKVEIHGETTEILTAYTAISKALLEEGVKKEYLKVAIELAEVPEENLEDMALELMAKMLKDKLKDTKED